MNATHRGLNRFLLVIIAVAVIAAGATVALSGIFPEFARSWRDSAEYLRPLLTDAFAQFGTFSLGSWQGNWLWLIALAVILVFAVLLLLWITSQGGGRTPVLSKQNSSHGRLVVRQELAQTSLREALGQDPRVLSTAVSTWKLGDSSGLKVTIQSRKGSSPREIADTAEQAVQGLDRLLGVKIPILISINAGARTGWSHQQRVE